MSKSLKVLLVAISFFMILGAMLLMIPWFIAWFYSLTPQGPLPLCDVKSYLFTWATNGIYVAILIIAVLAGVVAYLQLGSIRSQQEAQVIFLIYNYLYDDKFNLGKKKVYESEQMLRKKENIADFVPEIDRLLLLYNNIALLILNDNICQNALPTMFYANAVKVFKSCRYYIEFRQEKDPQYGKHYAEHFLRFIPDAEKYLRREEQEKWWKHPLRKKLGQTS